MSEQVNTPAAIFWWVLFPIAVLAILTWAFLPMYEHWRARRQRQKAVLNRERNYRLRGGEK